MDNAFCLSKDEHDAVAKTSSNSELMVVPPLVAHPLARCLLPTPVLP